VQTGTPEDVWFKPVSAAAARLLGDANILPGQVEVSAVQRCVLAGKGAAGTTYRQISH
jgi:ABC-type Fe3+/spermidine/putrescine transport system ATPase subunit